jgi:hypothetical protein
MRHQRDQLRAIDDREQRVRERRAGAAANGVAALASGLFTS